MAECLRDLVAAAYVDANVADAVAAFAATAALGPVAAFTATAAVAATAAVGTVRPSPAYLCMDRRLGAWQRRGG